MNATGTTTTETGAWDRAHLLGLASLRASDITAILDDAKAMLPIAARASGPLDDLRGKVIGNLFLEDSTRTRCSFTVAAHRLGATTVDLTTAGSSVSKGETYLDTAKTLEAMGIDALVMRCREPGSLATVAAAMSVPTINAGEGAREHPTQGLLDALVMREHLPSFPDITVGIVGDIAHSRVARSNVLGLLRLGARVRLIGPQHLLPSSIDEVLPDDPLPPEEAARVTIDHELDEHLSDLDVCMMLRFQFERGSEADDETAARYRLTHSRAARLPGHAIVMHPGPMNRGLEIDDVVADDPQRSVITEQVRAGVAVRMAVLRLLVS